MVTLTTPVERLNERLTTDATTLSLLDSYYAGTQPLSFLSPEAAAALGNRLRAISVNYARLSVDVLSERLRLTGFRINGASSPILEEAWSQNDMDQHQHAVHVEALALGRSFVSVWANADGSPSISVDSARDMAVERDPVTREVTAALKRWIADDTAYCVLYEADAITLYASTSTNPLSYPAPYTLTGSLPNPIGVPSTGWAVVNRVSNPLGRVPVVPFINAGGRLLDVGGVSAMWPILALTDALAKVTVDMLVSSEFYARPRRWATGIEIEVDADGNTFNPFADSPSRVWTTEAADARFGEFSASSLAGYQSAVSILTSQIGALTSLPPHVLGVHGDQPASADAMRSSESGLVADAVALQRSWGGRPWKSVASLVLQVATGQVPRDVEPVWASAETATPAQAADAAAKLVAAGILPVDAALDSLGYSPQDIVRLRAMRTREALTKAFTAPTPPPIGAAVDGPAPAEPGTKPGAVGQRNQ